MEKILIATSIAPFDIENQRKAVNSWLAAGFEVVSCNALVEIEQIKSSFPDIRFIPLERDATDILGKPYPYAYDVLQILKNEKHSVCGFINSDIHLIDFPEELIVMIYEHALNGEMVYSNRMETKSLEQNDIDRAYSYRGGFDFFIFNKQLIEIYQDDNMFVGNTMWDFWMLGIPYINNIRLTEIKNPVCYHISHKIRWDETLFNKYSKQLADKYCNSESSAFPFMMMTLVADLSNGLVYESDMVKEKRVLVAFPKDEEIREDTLKSLENQTHSKFDIIQGEPDMLKKSEYDYVFYTVSNQQYVHTAISLLLQEAERRNAETLQSDVALVGGDVDKVPVSRYIKTIQSQKGKNILCKIGIDKNAPLSLLRAPLSTLSIIKTIGSFLKEIERFYIYPAGEMSKWFIKGLLADEKKPLLGLCDKNELLWGKEINGFQIYSPKRLDDTETYDKILITSQFEEEIYNELKSRIPADKIVRLSELLNLYKI